MADDRPDCPLCGLGSDIDEPSERFAVWLHGRGWLVDSCAGDAAVAERLFGATWFSTVDEARTALLAIDGADDDFNEVGTVVTL